MGGVTMHDEREMLRDCYQAPLKGALLEGSLEWVGEHGWQPLDICIDWQDNMHWTTRAVWTTLTALPCDATLCPLGRQTGTLRAVLTSTCLVPSHKMLLYQNITE